MPHIISEIEARPKNRNHVNASPCGLNGCDNHPRKSLPYPDIAVPSMVSPLECAGAYAVPHTLPHFATTYVLPVLQDAGSEPAGMSVLIIPMSSHPISNTALVLTVEGLTISSMLPNCMVLIGRLRWSK